MKHWLTIAIPVLSLATAFPANSAPLDKKVTVDYREMPLTTTLNDLSNKAGVKLSFSDELVKGRSHVTLEMKNVEAGRALMRILRPRGLTLDQFDGNQATIVKADPYNGFKVDRDDTFAFAKEPVVRRNDNSVSISFETESWCDVTVAIEDSSGKIVRHLASGVLGPNAPPPFQWNTRKQTLIWDGKDDAGRYLKDMDAATVRVSLGLKPRFERTLFWHPGKGAGGVLAFAPSPEGVFVFLSGRAVDHLRMFDHDGNYVRTVYPFPHKNLDNIPGLIHHRFPDGKKMPIKPNWLQSSMLMSGSNCTKPTYKDGKYRGYRHRGTEMNGAAGYAMAVAGKRIALVGDRYSRLSTDGTSGGLKLHGSAELAFKDLKEKVNWGRRGDIDERTTDSVRPKEVAFSPDGEWMYLTMYNETHSGSFGHVWWRHAVMRKRYADDSPPEIFAGGRDAGKENGKFNIPSDVACDSRGRVYVADHWNDRIQVFDSEGKHLKNIPVKRPAKVDVDPDNGDIYVFSWTLPQPGETYYGGTRPTISKKEGGNSYFRLTKLSALDKAEKLETWDLHKLLALSRSYESNVELSTALDFWADPLTLWITAPSPVGADRRQRFKGKGIVVMSLENGEWTVKRDMLKDADRAIRRIRPAMFHRQRLYVNPTDGMLYLAEGQHAYFKGFYTVYQIDPETGRVREVELPMGAEDMAFDQEGFAYLLTSGLIMRYQSDTWREVPFDYGEEREKYTFSEGRLSKVISGAVFHAKVKRNQGGVHVTPDGRIVIGARYPVRMKSAKRKGEVASSEDSYQPMLFPGRRTGLITLVQTLDRHGKVIREDAVPGLHRNIDGTAMDQQGNIYIHTAQPMMINGNEHFNDHAGTIMKFTPGKCRVLTPSGAPIPLEDPPARSHDLARPKAWVEGAHWMYGGVGWGGQNYSSGCSCPNSRFALDYFARSFTPEIDRYNVGVVDSNGNLILRVGQCGNVDEGMPLVKAGGPPNPRSIGGDETALFYAPYVATHTDRRLFIADPGNARVVSVKLGYHEENKIRLKNLPDVTEEQ